MDIEAAIEKLKAMYEQALVNQTIGKPVAWALYWTWRQVDASEKPRREREA